MRRATVAAVAALGIGAAGALAASEIDLHRGGGWVSRAPSPLQRAENDSGRVGDRIYVVGGFEKVSMATTDAVLRYDISENDWTAPGELADAPVAVNHPGVVGHKGMLYVYGGFRAPDTQHEPSARLYRYNPETDHWKRLASSPTKRGAMGLAAIGGKLYAAAGKNAHNDRIRALEIYDISENRWTEGPKMGVGRNHVAAAVVDRKLYILGGRPGPVLGGRSTVERYNPKTKSWRRIRPGIPTARSGHAAAVVGDEIIVYGGENIDGPQNAPAIKEVDAYDVSKGEWRTDLPDMTMPRHGLGGVSFGSRVYALEGAPVRGLSFSNTTDYLEID